MELLTLLTRQAPNRMFLAILLGAAAGIGYSLLIPIVLIGTSARFDGAGLDAENVRTFLSFEVSDYRLAALFALACVVVLAGRALAQNLLTRVALDATTQLRIETYQVVLRARITGLETVGVSRLLAAITADVPHIVSGAITAPALLSASVTVASTLCWLAVLDLAIFRLVIGALVFGVLAIQIPLVAARKYGQRSRIELDALYESIRGLLYGSKELKLSKVKRERFFQELLVAREQAVLRDIKRANTVMTLTGNFGEMLSFFLIGLIAFVFVNYHALPVQQLVGIIMVMLFITGPVGVMLNSVPQLVMANVSLRAAKKLFAQLPQEDIAPQVRAVSDWSSVRFLDVSFRYGGEGFTLGPLSFEIPRGEITFIVGGNGSGKSTLGKLISLHYAPSGGEIRFGNTVVDRDTLNGCREQISAVYADYHLFDRLLAAPELIEPAEVDRHLRELGLHGKVAVEGGRFSTLALSEGQKKRLALLVAVLERREIYVLDEWAADQDPSFKDVFYLDVLQRLKARGATVIVISHDSRYFHVADRVLFMEEGKLVRTETARARPERAPGENLVLLRGRPP